MVEAVELLGVLDSHHILYVLYHTDGPVVAMRIAADRADVGVADVVAHTATVYLAPHGVDGCRQPAHIFHILTQQMKHKPQGGLTAYTRKF
jgi:hypothetical protein